MEINEHNEIIYNALFQLHNFWFFISRCQKHKVTNFIKDEAIKHGFKDYECITDLRKLIIKRREELINCLINVRRPQMAQIHRIPIIIDETINGATIKLKQTLIDNVDDFDDN